jgi:hypothetical protein
MELWSVQQRIMVPELCIETKMIIAMEFGFHQLVCFLTQSFGSGFFPVGLPEGKSV